MANSGTKRKSKNLLDQRSILDIVVSSSECFSRAMEIEKSNYENYDAERLDYIDIIEPIKKLISEFNNGNVEPVHHLFQVIDKNIKNCDNDAYNFVHAGILETLETRTTDSGNDSRTCYKMLMKQNVLSIWNQLL